MKTNLKTIKKLMDRYHWGLYHLNDLEAELREMQELVDIVTITEILGE